MINYYTIQNPPVLGGEKTVSQSLTRQSDNMDIKELITRFFPYGYEAPAPFEHLTGAALDEVFDGVSDIELEDADLVEQKNFVEQVTAKSNENISQEEKTDVKESADGSEKEPTATKEGE